MKEYLQAGPKIMKRARQDLLNNLFPTSLRTSQIKVDYNSLRWLISMLLITLLTCLLIVHIS